MKRKNQVDRELIRALSSALRLINTPRSLSVLLLLKHEEWDQLSTLEIDPSDYLDVPQGIWRYSADAQALALVRKVPWPTSVSRQERARETFRKCEILCANTNHFIDWLTSGVRPKDNYLNACRKILLRAQRFSQSVLGPVPDFLVGRFGPGTVFELDESPYATAADKVCITPHVTRNAEATFRYLHSGSFWESERMRAGLPFMTYARGNRFTTVPKDGKTDRGICVEPSGNIFVQLAIGDVMKARLKRVGIHVARQGNVDDPIQLVRRRLAPPVKTGQDIHRDLAVEASRDGSLATIDLSNASDTVARKLVEAILPADWFTLLDTSRSTHTRFQKKWVLLEKFSSMGNGFTFELETLIFLALIHGVCPHLFPGENLFVYGDDIIVPKDDFANVIACLKAFGFEPNTKKSFGTGFFRESCGGDFFCGFDVRPYFLKKLPVNPLDWMELYNGLRRVGLVLPVSLFWGKVPAKLRLCGPSRVSGVFHSSDRKSWSVVAKANTPHVTWLRTVVSMPLRIPLDRWGDWCHYLLALCGASSKGIVPANNVVGFRTIDVSIS